MQQPFSQAERAFRDTLIAKAEGSALDLLGGLYGLPRIPAIGRQYWRRVLQAAALGPRDRMGTLFEVLRALLEPWTVLTATTSNLRIATPQRLIGGTPAGNAWSCAHTHRLIEVGTKGVFWSTGITGADLDLCPVTTGYWKRAEWLADEDAEPVRVLPFWLREEGAVVTIYLDAQLFEVPPTYLQPEAVAARPAGQPIGGALVQDATISAALPGPLYLIGDGLAGLLQTVLDRLCAAGVLLQLFTLEWCSTDGLDVGTLQDIHDYGQPSAGGAPILTPPVGWP